MDADDFRKLVAKTFRFETNTIVDLSDWVGMLYAALNDAGWVIVRRDDVDECFHLAQASSVYQDDHGNHGDAQEYQDLADRLRAALAGTADAAQEGQT